MYRAMSDERDPRDWICIYPGDPAKLAEAERKHMREVAETETWHAIVPGDGNNAFEPRYMYKEYGEAIAQRAHLVAIGAIPASFRVIPWKVRKTKKRYAVMLNRPGRDRILVHYWKTFKEASDDADACNRRAMAGGEPGYYNVVEQDAPPEVSGWVDYAPRYRLRTRRERARYFK